MTYTGEGLFSTIRQIEYYLQAAVEEQYEQIVQDLHNQTNWLADTEQQLVNQGMVGSDKPSVDAQHAQHKVGGTSTSANLQLTLDIRLYFCFYNMYIYIYLCIPSQHDTLTLTARG